MTTRYNNQRKLWVAIAAVALATIGAMLAVATPAQADPGSPLCVTRSEFGQVHKGMTKVAVDREFGIHGRRSSGATSGGYRSEIWTYKPCTRFSSVAVAFSANPGGPLKLSAKSAVWSY